MVRTDDVPAGKKNSASVHNCPTRMPPPPPVSISCATNEYKSFWACVSCASLWLIIVSIIRRYRFRCAILNTCSKLSRRNFLSRGNCMNELLL